jgi:hypothetical protein
MSATTIKKKREGSVIGMNLGMIAEEQNEVRAKKLEVFTLSCTKKKTQPY